MSRAMEARGWHSKKWVMGAAGAAILAIFASQAGAQNAVSTATAPNSESSDADKLPEIVVTAQFREQSLQTTPIAISVVNAAMLAERGETDIAQIAAQAPNVSLVQQGGALGTSLSATIRGVGQTDFSPALEPGVGMYVDDVYYPTLSNSIVDLLDLDRIEVLRGPQGTLAGKDSIGGAIKLYSTMPTGKDNFYAEATTGSWKRLDFRGAADFALIPDKLFVRLSGVSRSQDGYVTRVDYGCSHPGSGIPPMTSGDTCDVGKEGGRNYTAERAIVRWLATDQFTSTTIIDSTNEDSEGSPVTLLHADNPNPDLRYPGVPNVPYDSRFVPTNPYTSYASFVLPARTIGGVQLPLFAAQDRNKFNGWGISENLDWTIRDALSIKSITAYRGYSKSWGSDGGVTPLPVTLGSEALENHFFSQELRLNGKATDSIDYTVGGYYSDQMTIYSGNLALPFISPAYEYLLHDKVPSKTEAGFAHAVWHATDKLDLTAGYRYTNEEKDYSFSRLSPDGVTPSPLFLSFNGSTGRYAGSNSDYRAAIDYKWTPTLMTYASFSTGFKGGGVNPRPYFGPGPDCPDPKHNCQVQPFGPEKLDAYEIGLKTSFFADTMRLNIAAFLNKYKDLQLTVLSCPQFSPPGLGNVCGMPQNAGDADIKGVEIETEIEPIKALLIDASASYLDFGYTKIDPTAGGAGEPTGIQFGMVPEYTNKWRGSAGIQYTIPVGASSLIPRLDASFQSNMFASSTNGPTNLINGYTLANARLSWRSEHKDLDVSIEVLNLTDRLYYITKADLIAFGGFEWAIPGPPRQWALSAKKSF